MQQEILLDGDNQPHLFHICVLCGLQSRNSDSFVLDNNEFVHKTCLEDFESGK